MPDTPSGTITFVFADIEGSTRLVEQLGDRYAGVLASYRRLIRAATADRHGAEVDTQGDTFFSVFPRAGDAVQAAMEMQRAVARHTWPEGAVVQVRVGIHTGEATLTDTGYVGMDVHRAARICGVAHGGQVLCSQATRNLAEGELPAGVTLRDLGEHRLKDLRRPERLFQVMHADLRADFPPLGSLDGFPNNLPRQLTSFVGREREMAEVRQLLSTSYLLTLTGPGGCGKTRLALQAAADLVEEFTGGVWLVELAAIEDSIRVPQAVASVLGVREMPGRSLQAALEDYLRARAMLLLLDGCEHLIEACAALADALLRACPGLRIVATSREPLHIAGEVVVRVPSLSTPDPRRALPLDALSQYEAVRLFLDRAATARTGFVLTVQNAPSIAQICVRLDGIPLAIELAAARVSVLSVEQIAARLDDRFQLLTGGSRTAQPRLQTLRATIDWSYDLLSDHERLLFRRLAVFAGGFTLDAAEAVCGGDGCAPALVLDLLTQLVDRSLVVSATAEAAGGDARFWMLETMRQYAADALQASGEAEEMRRRHLRFFLELAGRAEPELRGPHQDRWFSLLERERDNIRAAIRWGVLDETSRPSVLRLAAMLRWFWFARGHLSEGREALTRALEVARESPASDRARALSAAALIAWRQRDYAVAAGLGAQSEALCREAQDDRACAYALNAQALVARDQGDLARAEALHQETLTMFQALGDRWGVALAQQNLAYVAHRRGDAARAAALCEEALAIFRVLGDNWGIATSLFVLGRAAIRRGDHERARTLLEEALSLSRDFGDKPIVAFSLVSLGHLAGKRGDAEGARALLQESLVLHRELGDKRGLADVMATMASLSFDRGDLDAAAAEYREGLRYNTDLGNLHGVAEGLERLGTVVAAQGHSQRAALLLAAAEALREQIGAPPYEAERNPVRHAVSALREALGEEAFAAIWHKGRATRLGYVIDLALKPDGQTPGG